MAGFRHSCSGKFHGAMISTTPTGSYWMWEEPGTSRGGVGTCMQEAVETEGTSSGTRCGATIVSRQPSSIVADAECTLTPAPLNQQKLTFWAAVHSQMWLSASLHSAITVCTCRDSSVPPILFNKATGD